MYDVRCVICNDIEILNQNNTWLKAFHTTCVVCCCIAFDIYLFWLPCDFELSCKVLEKSEALFNLDSDLNLTQKMFLKTLLFGSFTAVCAALFRVFPRLLSHSHIDRCDTHTHSHQNGIRVIWFDGLELLVDLVIRSVAKMIREMIFIRWTSHTHTHTQLLLSCPLSSRVEINLTIFKSRT